jgi:hypothetical protein
MREISLAIEDRWERGESFSTNHHVIVAGVLSIFACIVGAHAPLLHDYMSIGGGFIFIPPGSDITIRAMDKILTAVPNVPKSPPNVIYVIAESLSAARSTQKEVETQCHSSNLVRG